MTFSPRSFSFVFASVSVLGLAACSNATSDAGGSSSSGQASTAPIQCPSGTIHPRTCTKPLDPIPGMDVTGDYALDVNNDVTAPCPDDYTPNDSAGDGICCVLPDPTQITECAEPFPKCIDDGDCGSAEVWTFAATQCSDPTWAATNPTQCGDQASDADGTGATFVHVPWADAGLTGP
jgi:hypothetical protein